MTPLWTKACCSKDAQHLGNILYCFKCGATKAVAIGTLPKIRCRRDGGNTMGCGPRSLPAQPSESECHPLSQACSL